jgi:predicted alpha/beta-hydrolase family hydrolase
MSLNIFGYLRPSQWSNHVKGLATVAPLMSGVIAPFSVLLDIPALSVSARQLVVMMMSNRHRICRRSGTARMAHQLQIH